MTDNIRRKIQEDLEKAKQRSSGGARYIPDGEIYLRICKWSETEPFYRMIVHHPRKGDFRAVTICRKNTETFDKTCALCKINKIATQEKKDRPFTSNYRYAIKGFDVNTDQIKIETWELPTSVFNVIAELYLGKYADIVDHKDGRAISIKKIKGVYTKYTVLPDKDVFPLGDELISQLTDPINSYPCPSLEEQCKIINVNPQAIFSESELEMDRGEVPFDNSNPKAEEEKQEQNSNIRKPECFGKKDHYDPEGTVCRNACRFFEECGKEIGK